MQRVDTQFASSEIWFILRKQTEARHRGETTAHVRKKVVVGGRVCVTCLVGLGVRLGSERCLVVWWDFVPLSVLLMAVGRWCASGGHVLFPLLLLHDLWAGSSGLVGSAGRTWSAVQGSLSFGPFPHNQQIVAVCLTRFASRL